MTKSWVSPYGLVFKMVPRILRASWIFLKYPRYHLVIRLFVTAHPKNSLGRPRPAPFTPLPKYKLGFHPLIVNENRKRSQKLKICLPTEKPRGIGSRTNRNRALTNNDNGQQDGKRDQKIPRGRNRFLLHIEFQVSQLDLMGTDWHHEPPGRRTP